MPNLRGQITISEALSAINPDAKTIIHGDDIDTCRIEWKEGTDEIDKADIKAKITELQAVYQANEYQRQRKVTYWPLADQLDALYWDKKNGTNVWEQHIEAVKNTFPKP